MFLFYGEFEVRRLLKARNPYLSLHTFDGVETMISWED
jgi:hypothetical protein